MALDVVAEIKAKLDPVEFIGRHTRLEKAGRNFRALCPFHTEKTASFYVFPDRGTWRCFGSCGEGGDIFSFVQKRENVDFREALRQLAAEAGVELSAESAVRRGRVEKLGAVVSAAVDFYQRCFGESGGAEARDYVFNKRGLSVEAVETFRIGWAPDEWRILRDYLGNRGYDQADMVAAGLLVEPDGGGAPYDRFRGRVVIPITDERGLFVGMGGRGLHGEEPKYLNSPQTELFDKGRTLYGLDLAAKAIREAGVAVVVEGYMDVIGPWQAGFRNVVATMGTSLTEHHAALLKRYAKRIVLAMDPDAAGLAAAERAGGLFLGLDSVEGMARSARSAQTLSHNEIDLRVAPLTPGYDPDEIARDDPDGWRRAIDNATPYVAFLLDRLADAPSDSPLDARRLVQRLKPVLLTVHDPIERASYVQRLARRLRIDEREVLQAVRLGISPLQRRSRDAFVPRQELTQEDYFVILLLKHPELRAEVKAFPITLLSDSVTREVFRRWVHGEPPVSGDLELLVERHQQLLGYRFPRLDLATARRALRRVTESIVRERLVANLDNDIQDMGRQELEVGADDIVQPVFDAWMGVPPAEDDREIVELFTEAQQLGLSIHRREEFDSADVAAR